MHVLVNAINDNALPRGPDVYLMQLLPQMLEADPGLRVTLVHAPWQKALAALDHGPRLALRVLAAPRRPLPRLLWQASGFVRFANALAPDVTFLPNLIWTPGLRSPTVLTAHDLLQFRTPEKFGRAKAAALRLVIRRALARADRIVAVSGFTAGDAVRLAGAAPARLRVIHEGGPAPRPRAASATGEGPPLFLFVGKLERTKGVETLIRAFTGSEALARRGCRLVIAGPPGNAAPAIRALLEGAAAADRVSLPGFLPGPEVERLYSSCRAFVFPSEAEGFGLVLLEAMAHGAPVIAARATALPEVVGEAGLLVEPGDVAGLRAALERLAADDALAARLREAGYRRLAAFDWAEAGRATAALLREAVA
ncbi:glycosyltransferase family 1 protein [Frigidibacter sp. MR17.14]|uniref:glycosyltransferase family 4 protein n=1 Tax=Frigidibacter sp. MR17.14 TaxID=3126509 RepID=UPI003012EF6C